jgi:CBS domain containing-hemolysin-like protein
MSSSPQRKEMQPASDAKETQAEALSRPAVSDADRDGIVKRFRQWLRANLRKHHDNSLKEALEEVLEEHESDGDQLPAEEQNMLKNVLSFSDIAVGDIKTPRTEIKAVEYTVTLEALKAHIAQHRHTRIPVYNDTLDTIKGFIHIKDLVPLLYGDSPFNMAFILRDILFVPPSMKLIHLLLKMRVSGVHMAIVVDEYGGTDGLVTLEDLFEKIVGEIQDEHDEDDADGTPAWTPQRTCDVDARMRIETLQEELKLPLLPEGEDNEYDTLGGLIFFHLGRVPARGETLDLAIKGRYEILSADPRRIHRVRIYAPEPLAQHPDSQQS